MQRLRLDQDVRSDAQLPVHGQRRPRYLSHLHSVCILV